MADEFFVDVKDLEKIAKIFGKFPNKVAACAAFGLNEAGKSVKTDEKRILKSGVKSTYTVKMGGIASMLDLERANPGKLIATISSDDNKKINIIRFKYGKNDPQNNKTGAPPAWADIKKTVPGITKGGFYQVMPNGGYGIFKRTSKNKYPIKRKHGLSYKQMIKNLPEVIQMAELDGVEEVFNNKFDYKLSKLIDEIFKV